MNNNWRGNGEAVFTFSGLAAERTDSVLHPASVSWLLKGEGRGKEGDDRTTQGPQAVITHTTEQCSSLKSSSKRKLSCFGLSRDSAWCSTWCSGSRCLFVNQELWGSWPHSAPCNGISLIHMSRHMRWGQLEWGDIHVYIVDHIFRQVFLLPLLWDRNEIHPMKIHL